jgi:hypothetical protein
VNSLSSSNNIWTSSNLLNLKDNEALSLSANLSNLNNFEYSRSWSMKKSFFTIVANNYRLEYNTDTTPVNNSSRLNNSQYVLSAYLLDYSLLCKLLSFSNTTTESVNSPNTSININLYSSENNIYQDSFNNYLVNLNSTTLSSNYNYYSYGATTYKKFSFTS